MVITGIKPKKKFMNSIYIDNEYFIDIDREVISIKKIKVGMEICEEELNDLIKLSNEKRAKEKALYLMEYRDHSKKELIDKIKKTSSEEAAKKAVDRLEEIGLINDDNFARKYANELIFRKKFAYSRAEYELIKKGIDKELAQEILDEIIPDPQEQIISLLESKYSNLLNSDKGLKRTVSSLQRLGYCWSDIKSSLNKCEYNYEEY